MKNHHHSHLHTDSTAQTSAPLPLSHDEIASCARELWEQQGCPDNRDEAIWLEAESRLLAAREEANREIPAAESSVSSG
jgi:hypothetical protein